MKTAPNDRISGESGQGMIRSPDLDSTEELVNLARDYFSSDFPNPGRVGCPERDELSVFVQSGRLPDVKLRGHLLGCSECFREYREAMSSRSAEQEEASPAGRVGLLSIFAQFIKGRANQFSHIFVGRAALIPVGLMSLLAVSIVGAYVWLSQRAPAPSQVKNVPEPIVTSQEPRPSEGPEVKPEGTPDAKSPIKQTPAIIRPRITQERSPELIVQAVVKIDLEEQGAIRSSDTVRDVNVAGSDNQGIIKLSPVKTRFLFSLPVNSIRGIYNVSIIDAFGKPLVTGRSQSSDGKRLIIGLNLKGLSENKYRLCVSHEDEVPDCYPVGITNNKSAPQVKTP
jgi:hypothetical protein